MSTANNQQPDAQPERRRRTMRPGLSLLASGEPMVWLTGGALVLCIGMIAGLTGFVVYSGLITFWPVPVVEIELRDGQHRMGEPFRTEEYTLTARMIEDMPPEIAAAAKSQLQGRSASSASRTLYRTGNNDITGTHFHWVSDFEIDETQLHSWAMTVERTEWGRFYGYPEAFVLRHKRPAGEAEEKLVAAVQFFESNKSRMSPGEQQRLETALAPVRKELNNLQLKSSRDFLSTFESGKAGGGKTGATVVVAEFNDGTSIQTGSEPVTLQPGRYVVEIRERWEGAPSAWRKYLEYHPAVIARSSAIAHLEKHRIGELNRREEAARLAVRSAEIRAERNHEIPFGKPVSTSADAMQSLNRELRAYDDEAARDARIEEWIAGKYGRGSNLGALAATAKKLADKQRDRFAAGPRAAIRRHQQELEKTPVYAQNAATRFLETAAATVVERQKTTDETSTLKEENKRYQLIMRTTATMSGGKPAEGVVKEMHLGEIVRAYPANQLSFTGKLSVYFSRWGEFLWADPREANSEGGVFPAIWGTVAMTMIMTVIVVPFGVLAALYLREYATGGLVVSAVRIAINNLAGVPSIVFGVFGLGFFCYIFGAYIDGGPAAVGVEPWPPATWFLCLAGLALTGAGAFFLGMLTRGGRKNGKLAAWAPYLWFGVWLATLVLFALLLAKTPFFYGFFSAKLPSPTFGKGGLFWASLTLALLTVPVVIVATEEALSAVPNSLREGSYACGAGKWQTIRRIVLPHAAPGIMTGAILAMARGAGEVAPLMLTGAVKQAAELPVDASAPFIHWERSFMHLGFHIYDLGFQSPNAEAAKPMVFTTTLVLIAIIAILNLSAVWLRSRLRKQFQSSHF